MKGKRDLFDALVIDNDNRLRKLKGESVSIMGADYYQKPFDRRIILITEENKHE